MTKDRTLTTAIHILSALAYTDMLLNSEGLALGLQTNAGLVRRILTKLSKSGLIVTTKGKHGGSKLLIPPKDITLKQIYTAVDAGPLFQTFTKEPFERCKVSCQIGGILDNVYEELENDLLKNMETITLSQIVTKIT